MQTILIISIILLLVAIYCVDLPYATAQNELQNEPPRINHKILVNGTTFNVQTFANNEATIHSVTLDAESKKLVLSVSELPNETASIQRMTVLFDATMLAGPYSLMFDDTIARENKDYFYTLDGKTTILLVSFPAETKMISIIGTSVVPEHLTQITIGMLVAFSIYAGYYIRKKAILHIK